MNLQAQANYMNTQIQTASPGELTLLLYNGCIRFMKQGAACMRNKDIEGKHTYFIKAQNIIDELQATLDMNYELSQDLNKLYDYIQYRLAQANANLDEEAIQNCIELVSDLRDSWAEAIKSLKVTG